MAAFRSVKLPLAYLALAAFLPAQPSEVRVQLSTAKTTYRLGEAIVIQLSFAAAEENKYVLEQGNGNRDLMEERRETFHVSPADGVSDPLAEFFKQGGGSFLSGRGTVSLTPIVIEKELNQWLRFDRPGHFRVRVTSHRVSAQGQPVDLESNEIELYLIDDPVWWSAQAAIEAETIRSTPNRPEDWAVKRRAAAAHRLWYLDTLESARESARLMDGADEGLERILSLGIKASSHKRELAETMQLLLEDPAQPVSGTFLSTLAALRASMGPSAEPQYQRIAAIQETLLAELAKVLDRKTSSAQPACVQTLIVGLSPAAIGPSQRAAIASVFSSLPADKQRNLLGGDWYRISSPAMLPVLHKFYDELPAAIPALTSQQDFARAVVQRLYELDPMEGRRILLDEISRPAPRLPFSTLSSLPDSTLPDLDNVLAANLEAAPSPEVEKLIARYATGSILSRMRAVYSRIDVDRRGRQGVVGNPPMRIASTACEPPLYAYFLRTDAAYGGRLLHDVIVERSFDMGRCWVHAIGETARYYVNGEWERIAVEALNDSTVQVKIDAVTALGKYGSPAALSHLWDSFQYWHNWWPDKSGQMNDENRQLENAFTTTFVQASNWIAAGDDLRRTERLCISENCCRQLEGVSLYWKGDMQVSVSQSENGDTFVNFAQYFLPCLAKARERLLLIPAGTRITWKVTAWNKQPSAALQAWMREMETELEKKGVRVLR